MSVIIVNITKDLGAKVLTIGGMLIFKSFRYRNRIFDLKSFFSITDMFSTSTDLLYKSPIAVVKVSKMK